MRTREALEKPSGRLSVAYVSHLAWSWDLGGGVGVWWAVLLLTPFYPYAMGTDLLPDLSHGFLEALSQAMCLWNICCSPAPKLSSILWVLSTTHCSFSVFSISNIFQHMHSFIYSKISVGSLQLWNTVQAQDWLEVPGLHCNFSVFSSPEVAFVLPSPYPFVLTTSMYSLLSIQSLTSLPRVFLCSWSPCFSL